MPSIIGGAWQRLDQRGGAGTGGRVKDFHSQQKTCHNYLWLLLGHIIGHIKLLFFLCDERPHIAGSLVEVGHRHLLPYTYNFQDNGGALGEVTVTNTGAPTESWAGCYMSDCANNHAELSRVCGVPGRREMGSRGGKRGERNGEMKRESVLELVCVNETRRRREEVGGVEAGNSGPGPGGVEREVVNRSWQIIVYFLPSDELLLNDCHSRRAVICSAVADRNWEGVTSACFCARPF